MSETKAKAAWGASRGSCSADTVSGGGETHREGHCSYGEAGTDQGSALIETRDNKVDTVKVSGVIKGSGIVAAGVLRTMKTREGIGLGTTFAAVKAAYPKGTRESSGYGFYYGVDGKGGAVFTFAFSPAAKVYEMSLTGPY